MSSLPAAIGIQVFDGATVPLPSPAGVTTITALGGALYATPPGSSTPVAVGGSGGFGATTTIQQANSALALVNTLQLINTLTVNTAGSETATWTIKVPSAGAQINAQVISGTGTLFPAGTGSVPAVQVNDAGTGMFKGSIGGNFVGLSVDGSIVATARTANFNIPGALTLFNGGHSVAPSISQDATVNNLAISASFSGQSDVVMGISGALATNATGGFVQIPTCAGTPTGTVHLNTGKAAMVLDTTANKLWLSSTAGTWKGVVIA